MTMWSAPASKIASSAASIPASTGSSRARTTLRTAGSTWSCIEECTMNYARAAIVSVLATMAVRPIAAKWHLGMELTTTRYGGTSHNTTDSGPSMLRPADATTATLRGDRTIRHIRIGVRVSYAKVGLVAGEGQLRLIDKSSGRLAEASVVANFQVVGIGSSGAIRAEVGPALHLWNLDDD